MTEFLKIALGTFAATLGYSLIYNTKNKDILFAAAGGTVTGLLFSVAKSYISNIFFLYFICALFAAVYSEVFARIRKTPANVFLFPGIIPLVPGGSLYYTLLYAIGKSEKTLEKGGETLLAALGIAFGTVVVSVVVKTVSGRKNTVKTNTIQAFK